MKLYQRYLSIIKEKDGTKTTVCDFSPEDEVMKLYKSLKEKETDITGTYSLEEHFVLVKHKTLKEMFLKEIENDSAEKNIDIVYNGKTYPQLLVLKFGQDLASLWGGTAIEYTVDTHNETISYICVEHGENFKIAPKFHELESWALKRNAIN